MAESRCVALVTGAAHGIGAAITRRLAGAGWRVAAVDSNADGLASLAGACGGAVRPCTADWPTRLRRPACSRASRQKKVGWTHWSATPAS